MDCLVSEPWPPPSQASKLPQAASSSGCLGLPSVRALLMPTQICCSCNGTLMQVIPFANHVKLSMLLQWSILSEHVMSQESSLLCCKSNFMKWQHMPQFDRGLLAAEYTFSLNSTLPVISKFSLADEDGSMCMSRPSAGWLQGSEWPLAFWSLRHMNGSTTT